MQATLLSIRERFHPLHHMRRSALGRLVLRATDRPVWISIPGIPFRVRGRRLSHGLSYGMVGSQERNPEALALACLKHFQLRSFWDVGANFGYYSWFLKSAVPDLNIVLIEPLPANAKLIRETIRRNGFAEAHLIEAAASDCCGEGVLHADVFSGSTSTLDHKKTFEQMHFGVTPKSISIPLVSIDSLRSRYDRVDFMKIDVERLEAACLRGAADTIARDQPILLVECCHPDHGCLSGLQNGGYRILDADNLSADCSGCATNYLCLPARYEGSIDAVLGLAKKM